MVVVTLTMSMLVVLPVDGRDPFGWLGRWWDRVTADHVAGPVSKAPASAVLPVTPGTAGSSGGGETVAQVEARLRADAEAAAARVPDLQVMSPTQSVVRDGASGRFRLEHGGSARFRPDGGGGWERIDPSLLPVSSGPVAAAAPGVLVPVEFGRSADDVVRFDLGGGARVTGSAPGLQVGSPKVEGDSVTYAQVKPDVDLTYRVGSDAVRETLVLGSSAAERSFMSHIADPSGVLGEPVAEPDGGWRFKGSDASSVSLSIPPAVAFESDSAGMPRGAADAPGTVSAHLSVMRSGDGWDVTKSVDPAWAEKATFPVTLDPTLFWSWGRPGWGTTGKGPTFTGYVCSSGCATTLTSYPYLYVGSGNGAALRSVIGYPYTTNDGTYRGSAVPANFNMPYRAKVHAADLSLQFLQCMSGPQPAAGSGALCPSSPAGSTQYLTVTPLTQDVSAGAPWSTVAAAMGPFTGFVTSSSPNVSYGPADRFGTNTYWQKFPVTPVVQGWVGDPSGATPRRPAEVGLKLYNEVPSTFAGSVLHGQTSATATSNPFLGVTWEYTTPGPPLAPAAAVNGSSVSATWGTSATGTWASNYHASIINAQTGISVRDWTGGQVNANTFADLPDGKYYLATWASNPGGLISSMAASPVFTIGTVTNASGMGVEPWWSFDSTSVGPQADARVNVGNGNLVVQQADTPPVQGHGQLGLGLSRTYNSQEPASLGILGDGLGRGWTFNVSAAGDLGAPLSAGLVPSDLSALTSGNVTLVDRDGTRHKFAPNQTAAAVSLGVGNNSTFTLDLSNPSLVGSLLGSTNDALESMVGFLRSAPNGGLAGLNLANLKVCVTTSYKAPAGVHLGLWRFVGVGLSTPCDNVTPTSGPNSTAPIALGYATVRPDRVRQIYSVTGQLLSTFDKAGNELRYAYGFAGVALNLGVVSAGQLTQVYEPKTPGCAIPALPSCRSFRFLYLPTGVVVTDPAGRTTNYTVNLLTNQLTQVSTASASGAQLGTWNYTYQDLLSPPCGGNNGQLCTITNPMGKKTTVGYTAGKVTSLAEPFDAADGAGPSAAQLTTTFAFTAGQTDVTQDGRVTRYAGIDSAMRVADRYQGSAAQLADNQALTHTNQKWDTAAVPCQPADNGVNNNLCSTTTFAGTVAGAPAGYVAPPDQKTDFVYNPEGGILTQTQQLASGNLVTENRFLVSSWLPGQGTATQQTEGFGAAASAARPATALFTINDLVASKSPKGVVTYNELDIDPTKALGKLGTACGSVSRTGATQTGGGNTGLACNTWTSPDGTRTHPEVQITTKAYDATYGQVTSVTDPTGAATSYEYYSESANDVSNQTSAGGWLKTVTDATEKWAAFGYDRAGNVIRAYDRNSTNGQNKATFNPNAATPTAGVPFAATRYGTGTEAQAAANPWWYVRSTATPLAETTTIDVDLNGNPKTVTSPMFEATAMSYTARDQLLTTKLPADTVATIHRYDGAGNRTATTDPNTNVIVTVFDPAGRAAQQLTTRGPWASANSTERATCRESTPADAPIAAGKTVCTVTTTYAGSGQPVATTSPGTRQDSAPSDPVTATSWTTSDGAGRQTQMFTPRSDGVYQQSAKVYDADGNVTTTCSPRQFTDEASVGCTAASHYATHTAYDGLNRSVTQTTYRELAGFAGTIAPTPSWKALVTTTAYNTPARTLTTWDPNAHDSGGIPLDGRGVTTTLDTLARKTKTSTPRSATETIEHTWAYDPAGNTTMAAVGSPVAVTHRTASSFDADNRLVDTVTAATSPLAATASNTYLSVAGTNPANLRTRTYYDKNSRPVATLDARGFTASVTAPDTRYLVRTERDPNGRPAARWTPLWDTTNAGPLDATGGPERAQCPAPTNGRQPQAISGVPLWPSNVGVCREKAVYDPGGRLTSVIPATEVAAQATTSTWTDDNLLAKVTVPNRNGAGTTTAQELSYDGAGRQIRSFDPNGNATGSGVTAGYETVTTWTLDGLKDTEAGQQPGSGALRHQEWTYTPDGLPLTQATQISAGRTDTATFAYYADGKPRTQTTPGGRTSAWAYDPSGNPTTLWSPSAVAHDANNTSGAATVNTFTWDNLLASTLQPVAFDGSTARSTTYGYRPDGAKTAQHVDIVSSANPATVVKAGGTQTFTWSPNRWPLIETGRGGEQVHRTFDPTGQLTIATDTTSGTTTAVSRLLNQATKTVTTTVAGVAKTTGMSWQADGLPDHLKAGSGDLATVDSTQTWAYNDARLNTATTTTGWGGTSSWTTSHDPAGRPDTMTGADGRTTTWGWRADSLISSKTLTGGTATIDKWSYGSHDMAGRPLSETRTDHTGTNKTHTWTWTPDGQIGSVDGAAVTWDADGNRTSYKGGTASYQADDAIRPSATIDYDAQGNQTKNQCGTTGYDGLDRTTTAVNSGSSSCGTAQTETIGYDGLGRRATVSATTGRTDTYTYTGLGPTVLADDTNTTATTARYLQGPTGTALAVVDGSGNRQTLATDLQGSTALTLNSTLPPACQASYDPWGDPEDPGTPGGVCQGTGSTPNGRWYRQQQRDTATGNYQNGARSYNPASATWLNTDSYKTDGDANSDLSVGTDPLTQNRFAYVNGDPINFVDPSGHKRQNACEGMSKDQCAQLAVAAYVNQGSRTDDPNNVQPSEVQLNRPAPPAPITPEQTEDFRRKFHEPRHSGIGGLIKDTGTAAIHGFLQGGLNVGASTMMLLRLTTPACQLSTTCRDVGDEQIAALRKDPVGALASLNPVTAPVNNLVQAATIAKKHGLKEGWLTLAHTTAQQGVPAVLTIAGIAGAGALSKLPATPTGLARPGALRNAAEGAPTVTEPMIRQAMADAPLQSQQGAVSLPRVQSYVDKLAAGSEAPAIKIDGSIIVDGNHRYIAGRIMGQEPAIQPWPGGSSTRVVPWWKQVVDPAEWLG